MDKNINKKKVEDMLSEDKTLTPDNNLRDRILARCENPVSEAQACEAQACQAKDYKAVTNTAAADSTHTLPVRKKPPLRMITALAASFLIVFTATLFGITTYATEYETVYIDVNPSLELAVNRADKVISVRYINEDARQALDGVKLKGKNIDDAVEAVMDALDRDGYMDGAELSIGVICKNQDKADKTLEKLQKRANECAVKNGYNVKISGSNVTAEEKAQAQEIGMSPVKYKMICEIIAADPSYTLESLKNISMKELKAVYKEVVR